MNSYVIALIGGAAATATPGPLPGANAAFPKLATTATPNTGDSTLDA